MNSGDKIKVNNDTYTITATKGPLRYISVNGTLWPFDPDALDKVLDYLNSKEDMGLIYQVDAQVQENSPVVVFIANGMHKELWERVMRPEIQRHVKIVWERFIRHRGCFEPTHFRFGVKVKHDG
jgi:hypothetical protein